MMGQLCWRPLLDPAPWPQQASVPGNLLMFGVVCLVAMLCMRILIGGTPRRVLVQGLALAALVWGVCVLVWWLLG